MINKFTLLATLLLGSFYASAQDSVKYRVILIGDAGEMDKQQGEVMKHASAKVITNKTTVMYLGDNIYPRGMGLPGSPQEKETEEILRSQYQPFRAVGAPVYFVPGNHDWDRMGPLGLAKIKRQWAFLEEQKDPQLKMVPRDGCPDPVEINVSDNLTIIAFDSEWWVYTYKKDNPDAECDCNTKDAVIDKLEELFQKNRGKVILLASHHPFQTYGTHGGYYSFKDHLFPLTAANKNLYIPLPVIGSLYPLLRTLFTNPEDTGHPLYKSMIARIDNVFKGYPNMVHVAGHEHGLQFIKNKQKVQVVSGAGAKNTYAKKGKHSLFADATQGYVTADILLDNSMVFTYYIVTDEGVKQAFTYKQPYTPIKDKEVAKAKPIAGDSTVVKIRPEYNNVSGFHKSLFGKNYREEWAAATKLPVIRISQIAGGLKPTQLGGGYQSKSLRLVDKSGKEWVLRSVEKSPEKVLPPELQETFAKDWVNDAMSAQHPYSALIVPPLAEAAGVPHANPIIGIVSADDNLGKYADTFTNMICLLEEREPAGDSKNTIKMIKDLNKDNDNTYDSREFLRARMLDLLIGDWDRHEDQWRWIHKEKDGKTTYTAVPRDRDQVLYTNEGLLPSIASLPFVVPTLQGFDSDIPSVKWSIFKTRFLNMYPATHFSLKEWMQMANEFVAAETDAVLEAGLRRLPESAYKLRHDELLKTLKERRAHIPEAMAEYYRFMNKIVDIRTTDKNELVEIKDDTAKSVNIVIRKINKDGVVKDTLLNNTFAAGITKEIRLYVEDGDDHVVINKKESPINIRLIGKKGDKVYDVVNSNKSIKLYNKTNKITFKGDSGVFNKHISADSANTAFEPVNLYNTFIPMATAGLNADDGFSLGLGFRYIHQQGFHKQPYNYSQQLMVSHSFATKAFAVKYNAEWIRAIGKADLTLQVLAKAPDNAANFFGRGNESVFDRTGNFKRYYRTRYNTFQFDPALRWHTSSGSTLSIGPSVQLYHMDASENVGRFINNTSLIGSYDSATVAKDKAHAGVIINYISDTRNNAILPTWGNVVNIKIQGYAGLNSYSKSFIQILPEVAFYKSLNSTSTIVLADRLGGGVTIGKTAFYQSLFLGGQQNLLGFRNFRFAGQHSVYNNLELRIKIGDFASYVLPGQFGITGFFDTGRVWEKGENSDKWHIGNGGGIYFAPARMAVVQLLAGHSDEGWYPYLLLRFRY
ncbi:metallophosphoesterase [Mucilaginibacter gynuensis]|uniref:Metallophosphoesterase n=1 Tax=Mucilaginibacter gynuensis TaxID=1302236 RepID=A0ABP8FM13_9SPHI